MIVPLGCYSSCSGSNISGSFEILLPLSKYISLYHIFIYFVHCSGPHQPFCCCFCVCLFVLSAVSLAMENTGICGGRSVTMVPMVPMDWITWDQFCQETVDTVFMYGHTSCGWTLETQYNDRRDSTILNEQKNARKEGGRLLPGSQCWPKLFF